MIFKIVTLLNGLFHLITVHGGWGYIFFRKFTLVTFLKVWPSWHMFPVPLPSWHFALLFLPSWHHSLYPRDISFFTLVTGVRIHIFFAYPRDILPLPSWHKDYIPSWHEKTATLVTIYPHPHERLLNGKAQFSTMKSLRVQIFWKI